ncbi:MAG TPA: nucleotide sugar dehydrogenase [Sporichthyaceae bacterium]
MTAACLAAQGHEVVGVDVDPIKVEALRCGHCPVVEPGLDEMVRDAVRIGRLRATSDTAAAVRQAELSLVCVGTPSRPDGSADLTQVRRVVEEIGLALADGDLPHTVVIRSTVPPGAVTHLLGPLLAERSGRRLGVSLDVAMCPEFLREGSGVRDFHAPPLLVIGGSDRAVAMLRELFDFLDCEVHTVPVEVAESIKYSCNAFHAVKVAFANEMSRLLRRAGVDSREVMNVFVRDTDLNISPAYLRPGFAFGGSCLPKDLRSLLHLGRTYAVDLPLLTGVLSSNELVVRDLAERVLRRVEDRDPANRRVAMLGLSFKAETDDLRESPNVALAEYLLGKGVDLRIHDPIIKPARLTGSNLRHVQTRLPHLQRLLTDTAEEALDGAVVAILAYADESGRRALQAASPDTLFDLNGYYGRDIDTMPGYEGVGW